MGTIRTFSMWELFKVDKGANIQSQYKVNTNLSNIESHSNLLDFYPKSTQNHLIKNEIGRYSK